MKTAIIAASFLLAAFEMTAGTPSHGPAVLRNLAVAPIVSGSFNYKYTLRDGLIVLADGKVLPEDIRKLESALKEKPGDTRRMLELAEVLDQVPPVPSRTSRGSWLIYERRWRRPTPPPVAPAIVCQ